MSIETLDRRKVTPEGEVSPGQPLYDTFQPTLAGVTTAESILIVRLLRLPQKGLIATPDAYSSPVEYGLVVVGDLHQSQIVRFPEGVGTTIEFSDTADGDKFREINLQDVTCFWES